MIGHGHIDPIWNQQTLDQLVYQRKDMSDSPSRGEDIYVWSDLADRERYWDMISLDVADDINTNDFWHQDPWPELKEKFIVVHHMKPGLIQPLHGDLYRRYSKNHNVADIENITRVLIFLTDWQMGQIFHCDGQCFDDWRAGDWVSWTGTATHIAGNFGNHSRYTMQITGLKQ